MKKDIFCNIKGEVITSRDREYMESRMAWNRAVDKKPKAIIFCKDKEDIKEAIKVCIEEKLEFRIRSGRHHYEGYSTGDNLIVIDVSKINKIKVDLDKNIVKIEAGVRNRELYEAVGKYDIPFPGGGCPTVGAVGYTLGGGWGYSCRHLGLGIDSLVECKIINYKGEELTLNREENPSLFWAIKGAGAGNFGVVSEMTFKLPKKEKMGTLIAIDEENITLKTMEEIFINWDSNIEDLDSRLNMKVAFYNSKEKGLGVKALGIFYGNLEEGKREISKIISPLEAKKEDFKEMSILHINRWIQDNHPDYEKYKSGGRVVKESYKREEIKKILEILKRKPEESIYTAISLYGLGGRVENGTEGAFPYKMDRGILGFQSMWERDRDKEINCKWVLENIKEIYPLTKGSFIGFPIEGLKDYEKEYFLENKERLREIKREYDPLNIFKFEQGIKI